MLNSVTLQTSQPLSLNDFSDQLPGKKAVAASHTFLGEVHGTPLAKLPTGIQLGILLPIQANH